MARRWTKALGIGACAVVIFTVAASRNDPAGAEQPPPAPAVVEGAFVVAPYLQYATRTSITVMWETEAPCTAEVRYGTKTPPEQVAKVEKSDTMGEVALAKYQAHWATDTER